MPTPLIGNRPVSQENMDGSFPMTGESLRATNKQLLQETLWATVEKMNERAREFDDIWQERWKSDGFHSYFQTMPAESPFSKFSSQGWKLHIAFEKGKEEDVSKFLFSRGLYFKTEAGMGTAFNGNQESGSTIYAGSHFSMECIAGHVSRYLKPLLRDGQKYAQPINGKDVLRGSGTDQEIRPRVMARFDAQKSPWGLKRGSGKYGEDGLPSWVNAYGIDSGLPVLSEDNSESSRVGKLVRDRQANLHEVLNAYKALQQRSRTELIGDFGHDFVLGERAAKQAGSLALGTAAQH